MLIDGLIALITGDGAITAPVYKSVLPRGYTLPAIAVHRYDGTQDYQFDGPTDPDENKVQFDVYGKTADECQQQSAAVRALLVSFTGTLPGGTRVQGCFLERDMDMPFLPNADTKGLAFRAVLGFRIISV